MSSIKRWLLRQKDLYDQGEPECHICGKSVLEDHWHGICAGAEIEAEFKESAFYLEFKESAFYLEFKDQGLTFGAGSLKSKEEAEKEASKFGIKIKWRQ